jgi:hypothetical protein
VLWPLQCKQNITSIITRDMSCQSLSRVTSVSNRIELDITVSLLNIPMNNLNLIPAEGFWEDSRLARRLAVNHGYGLFESGNDLSIIFEIEDE